MLTGYAVEFLGTDRTFRDLSGPQGFSDVNNGKRVSPNFNQMIIDQKYSILKNATALIRFLSILGLRR